MTDKDSQPDPDTLQKNLILAINTAFMKLSLRAEMVERSKLVGTFVDVGPLFTALYTTNHQIIYGRRGTGKTHALLYLAEKVTANRHVPIYLDLRTIGSTGGIYADPNLPLTERGTRLLEDTLGAIHTGLLAAVTEREDLDLGVMGPLLDDLATEISRVTVEGTTQVEGAKTTTISAEESDTVGLKIGPSTLSVELGGAAKEGLASSQSEKISQSGPIRHRVHFGAVSQALQKVIERLQGKQIWLILDEWSAVPLDLQPLLADLLRRSVFPIRGITVKIGAIEQRSHFQIAGTKGDYIGIELGADASADLNLDDFMVFDNDEDRATEFFEQLLFAHFNSEADEQLRAALTWPHSLSHNAFTRRDVFKEFVRATEGVPRDAINILSFAARTAFTTKISMEHIRMAAKKWYQQDKDRAVAANPRAKKLLHKIIDEVIGHRQARAFLFRNDSRHDLLDELFDRRVLHVLKKNISSRDEPGVRYDVFKIDYGCYVDLLTTNKAPRGLLLSDAVDEHAQAMYINVPPDDYPAIRRAILDISLIDGEEKK